MVSGWRIQRVFCTPPSLSQIYEEGGKREQTSACKQCARLRKIPAKVTALFANGNNKIALSRLETTFVVIGYILRFLFSFFAKSLRGLSDLSIGSGENQEEEEGRKEEEEEKGHFWTEAAANASSTGTFFFGEAKRGEKSPRRGWIFLP